MKTATEHKLPVKLCTRDYYAGQDGMPLTGSGTIRLDSHRPVSRAPERGVVFRHICYPHYEELIAAAKHYANAYVDMVLVLDHQPSRGQGFLKKFLVTAPANKILTFGGDYIPVEPVLGHAAIARRGIALALSELVEEGWLSMTDAMDLIDPIMHDNARQIFSLAEKLRILEDVKWT